MVWESPCRAMDDYEYSVRRAIGTESCYRARLSHVPRQGDWEHKARADRSFTSTAFTLRVRRRRCPPMPTAESVAGAARTAVLRLRAGDEDAVMKMPCGRDRDDGWDVSRCEILVLVQRLGLHRIWPSIVSRRLPMPPSPARPASHPELPSLPPRDPVGVCWHGIGLARL